MRLHALMTIAFCLCLAACGEARAASPDPASDVDCSVLAFTSMRFAERSGAPADQRHAAQVVHSWYAAKVRPIVSGS